MSNELVSIILEFEQGTVIISDDRGGSTGDISITFEMAKKRFNWWVSDLVRKTNITAPKKFHEDTGKPYNPMPANMWGVTRQAIAIIKKGG